MWIPKFRFTLRDFHIKFSNPTPLFQSYLSEKMTKTLRLYGGAVTIQIPTLPILLDVSEFRQVPDSQEVHTSTTGSTTLIIELLESQPPYHLESKNKDSRVDKQVDICLETHFWELATDNRATRSQIKCIRDGILEGVQYVSKFAREQDATSGISEVNLLIGVLDISRFQTQVLFTLSVSSDAALNGDQVIGIKQFTEIIGSFNLVDEDLFIH